MKGQKKLINFSGEQLEQLKFLCEHDKIRIKTPFEPNFASVIRVAVQELYDKYKLGENKV